MSLDDILYSKPMFAVGNKTVHPFMLSWYNQSGVICYSDSQQNKMMFMQIYKTQNDQRSTHNSFVQFITLKEAHSIFKT